MSQLITSPGTLRTEAIAEDGEKKTIVSRWVDAITSEVAKGHVQTTDGLIGPTISARLYSMVGAAAHQAWRVGSNISQNLVPSDSNNTFIEGLISATILKVAQGNSGMTAEGLQNLKEFASEIRSAKPSSRLKIHHLSTAIAQSINRDYDNDGYDAPNQYSPTNSLENIIDLEQWTPEFNASDLQSSGIQSYLTPHWGQVTPAGISRQELAGLTASSGAPEPFLLNGDDSYDLITGTLTEQSTGATLKITPSLIGTHINPGFIDQANQVIAYSQGLTNTTQGQHNKATAEFWEDGDGTPFPPGTWLVIGQALSLEQGFSLEMDAKLFEGLGASMHAAAISAWDRKLQDNYARPIRTIRELSKLGLLTDDDAKTPGSQFRAFNRTSGEIDLISGVDFETYQLPHGGYSPPFAEFTSGHSTFSAAAAEFLTRFANSNAFPWDIEMQLTFPFPNGEGAPVTLSYDSLQDAAEAAGESRLHGGIHFEDGNNNGLLIGRQIGACMFDHFATEWALQLDAEV